MRPLIVARGRRFAGLALLLIASGCETAPSFERIDDAAFVDVAGAGDAGAQDAGADATLAFGCALLDPDTCDRLGTVCCVPGAEVCTPSLGRPNQCVPAGTRTTGEPCSALDPCASYHVCVASDGDETARCRRVCGDGVDCIEGVCDLDALLGSIGVGVCL